MNTETQDVTARITTMFAASGHRRCDSAIGRGSCKRILRISEYGKATTRIANIAEDTHPGIYVNLQRRSPAKIPWAPIVLPPNFERPHLLDALLQSRQHDLPHSGPGASTNNRS